MQILINIDDEDYDDITLAGGNTINIGVLLDLREAVRKGAPLPKGHGRLIDADQAISKICGSSCGCHLEECGNDKHCYSVTRIESAPTIIEKDDD